ncbi:hypothetical protein PLANTIT3_20023 [Plantibacter sp. T3]|nr:hypothetical protein PLANTIT3_20023 [Plantibacter sp. T3]
MPSGGEEDCILHRRSSLLKFGSLTFSKGPP